MVRLIGWSQLTSSAKVELSHINIFIGERTVFIRQNFRIYPTKEQQQFFLQDMGNQRFIWNYILSKSIEKYEQEKKFIWYHEAASLLPELKKELDWLKLGNSQALQQTLKDLDQAFKDAFKKTGTRSGFPKFKKKESGGSCRYPSGCSIENSKLSVPKLKSNIKVAGENIPIEFKSCTVSLKPSGKWFISLVVEIDEVSKVEFNSKSKVVGIDLNSKYFVVLDNGDAVVNPKHLLKKEKQLKRYQRRMSRKVKGSNNRSKQRIKVARKHESVASQRKEFVEQLTTELVKEYDVLVIEDLNVKAMQKWNGRMIQSAPFGLFRSKLTWKANKHGKHLIVIDRFAPTSKVCNECGQIHQFGLNVRWLNCDCGAKVHRDLNAAINIKNIGISTAGMAGSYASGDAKVHGLDVHGIRWVSLKEENTPSSAVC